MARLAEIRRKREADKARREAEDAGESSGGIGGAKESSILNRVPFVTEAQRAKDARANQRTAPTSRSRK